MAERIQASNSTEAFWTLDPFAIVRPSDPWFVDLEKIVPREHYGVSRKGDFTFSDVILVLAESVIAHVQRNRSPCWRSSRPN